MREFLGHDAPVQDLAFSPDARWLVSSSFNDASQNGWTRVWNVETGKSTVVIPEGSPVIRMAADGATFALAVANQVRVYRTTTGEEQLRSPRLHEVRTFRQGDTAVEVAVPLQVRILAISPDRRWLAGVRRGSRSDGTLLLFDVRTGRQMHELVGCQSAPRVAVFSRDGHTLAAEDGGRSVLCWECATGGLLRKLDGHERRVAALSFSPDARFLALGSFDRSVRIHDLATGREVFQVTGHAGLVTSVGFDAGGHYLLSGSTDHTVLLWAVGELLHRELSPQKWDEAALAELWHDLSGPSAARAYAAMARIADDEAAVMADVRQRVESQLIPAQAGRVGRLIADLDHDDSLVRQRATIELQNLFADELRQQVVKPMLLSAMQKTGSAEVRYRIRRILRGTPGFPEMDIRRLVRVVHALQQSGSPDARQLLQLIADGFPAEAVTREAKAALAWLDAPPPQ